MSKKTNAAVETKTEKKAPISLIGRGKLIRETASREGMTLQEFTDVVREKYPIGGPNWFAKQFKKAQARIAKRAAKTATPAPAPAAAAPAPAPVPAPVETQKPKGKKKSAKA